MPAGRRVFVSSSAVRARTVAAVVAQCADSGLDCIELTSSFPYYPDIRSDVIAAHQQGVRLLLHNYFPPHERGFVLNLASGDATVRRLTTEHCRAALMLSAEIGAPFFSVHAGFAVDPAPEELGVRLASSARRSKTDAAKSFFDAVAMLCQTAEQLGVTLLIENNVLSRKNLVNGRNDLLLGVTGDDFDELFDAVPSARLGLLLDVGHLKVSAQTLQFDPNRLLEQMRPHVRALHLSDNDGETDSNRPFDSNAWFMPCLRAFADSILVIETRPLEPAELVDCVRTVEAAA